MYICLLHRSADINFLRVIFQKKFIESSRCTSDGVLTFKNLMTQSYHDCHLTQKFALVEQTTSSTKLSNETN